MEKCHLRLAVVVFYYDGVRQFPLLLLHAKSKLRTPLSTVRRISSKSPLHVARATSMQLLQESPLVHCTSVVGRPSEVNSGALPPHPPSPAIKAINPTLRNNASCCRQTDARMYFIVLSVNRFQNVGSMPCVRAHASIGLAARRRARCGSIRPSRPPRSSAAGGSRRAARGPSP